MNFNYSVLGCLFYCVIMWTDQYGENEDVLKQFDMNMVYGPCLGMTRLERWERAKALGLNPPNDLLRILEGKNARQECLWDCRV